MNGAVPIASRPATFFFETLISLVGEIDPGLAGIALVDRSLRVVERDRHLSRWLPHPGQRCTECAVLLAMDEAILALIDGPRSSLVIPSIELASTGEPLCLAIAITWHAERGHFIIASYPDHRSPEGEWLLATERRQKRLAEERLQALGLHFEIEQARYRHIVEAGTDLVLRFTREHILTFANRAALDLSGAREHDMVGAPLRRFFGPHLDPRPWDALAAGNDAIASFEQEVRTAAGEQAWIWWHVSAVGGAPGAEFQAVGRDITVLHKLRQETERANANAEAAAATRERLRIARAARHADPVDYGGARANPPRPRASRGGSRRGRSCGSSGSARPGRGSDAQLDRRGARSRRRVPASPGRTGSSSRIGLRRHRPALRRARAQSRDPGRALPR